MQHLDSSFPRLSSSFGLGITVNRIKPSASNRALEADAVTIVEKSTTNAPSKKIVNPNLRLEAVNSLKSELTGISQKEDV